MKNAIFIMACTIVFILQSCIKKSVEKGIPERVKLGFDEKFPGATGTTWRMENDLEWEATFKWKEKEYSANFSNEGKWLETEHMIMETEIPSNIRAILDQNFLNYRIEEPEIVETASGIYYEMEIETDKDVLEISIDSKGVLTREKENDEDNEDDEV